MFLAINLLFLLKLSQFAFCQNRKWTLLNKTFSPKYIFQSVFTDNYTDQINDSIRFNYENTFFTEIVMTRGSFIIGLYIPP